MGRIENGFLNLLMQFILLPIKFKWAIYFSAILYTIWSELYIGVNRVFPLNILGALFILGYLQTSLFLSFHYSRTLFRTWTRNNKKYLQSALIIGICFLPGFFTFKIIDEIKEYEFQNNSENTSSLVIVVHNVDKKVKYEFQVDGWNYQGWTKREQRQKGDEIIVEYSKSFPALNRELEKKLYKN
ncbi:hypothetical protein [Flammeovirga sp. SJP92]|uniref:hypothetical protein n=1 Tax=Flammeovirga sp. SJP92 TaxID=1775430 RepID=UPI00078972AD|nr:hypothetical protein [Flammeovirga sp. SJP92]KXX69809.1 hypothetical protein AVL50_13040 [Flammeovirga sp. SJP92]